MQAKLDTMQSTKLEVTEDQLLLEVENVKEHCAPILNTKKTTASILRKVSTNTNDVLSLFHLDGYIFDLNQRVEYWLKFGKDDLKMLQDITCALAYLVGIDATAFKVSQWSTKEDEAIASSLLTRSFLKLQVFYNGTTKVGK